MCAQEEGRGSTSMCQHQLSVGNTAKCCHPSEWTVSRSFLPLERRRCWMQCCREGQGEIHWWVFCTMSFSGFLFLLLGIGKLLVHHQFLIFGSGWLTHEAFSYSIRNVHVLVKWGLKFKHIPNKVTSSDSTFLFRQSSSLQETAHKLSVLHLWVFSPGMK